MTADLTNLLPEYRKRALARDYLVRIGVVALWLAAVLVVVHGVLLVPSYLYASQQARTHEAQLASLAVASDGTTEDALTARITALDTKAKELASLAERPTASGAIRAVLAVPRTGVRVNGFTFAPAAAADGNRMTLNGTASTRDALRSYLESLDALPFVAKAELPISAYADVTDISFTITLTGSFLP